MKLKILVLAVACAAAAVTAEAQQPPTPETPGVEVITTQEAPGAFSFSFGGHGYLGVLPVDVTKENAAKFGLRDVRGVAVGKVVPDSPAARAGLLAGDVILEVDGETVSSAMKLQRLIGEVAPDHEAALKISRAGSEKSLRVTIGRPTEAMAWSTPSVEAIAKFKVDAEKLSARAGGLGKGMSFSFGAHRRIGVGTAPIGKQLADFFGVRSGILITSVEENSPAAKAGLKAGDVITEIEGTAVDDVGDLVRALNGKEDGDVTLTIVRDKNSSSVRVTPEKRQGSVLPFKLNGMTSVGGEGFVAPEQQEETFRVWSLPDGAAPRVEFTPGPVAPVSPVPEMMAPGVLVTPPQPPRMRPIRIAPVRRGTLIL